MFERVKLHARKLRTTLAVTALCSLIPLAGEASERMQVHFDPGGSIRERFEEIERLNADGTRIEIRFGICASACTLYLSADDVCVTPSTTLIFHGPRPLSSLGLLKPRELEPDVFERWSKVVAAYYPEWLRDWYLETGRYGEHSVSGKELIKHGVRQCEKRGLFAKANN